jgi:hypothetical protein
MSNISKPITKRTVNDWIEEQVQENVPRWLIYKHLSSLQSLTDELDEIQVYYNAMSSLEDIMVDRNIQGIALEKEGKKELAIPLYEANVSDHFDGSHPYERLRIIYTYGNDYHNAIRICEAYINNVGIDAALCDSYLSKIVKLKEKINR